jgi:predicted O-methyltransferase YrrM
MLDAKDFPVERRVVQANGGILILSGLTMRKGLLLTIWPEQPMSDLQASQTFRPGDALTMEAIHFHEVMEGLYRHPATHPGSIDTETGRFLHALVRLVRPELVVEVGTHHGVSTLWLARGIEDNGTGRLISLDLFTDPPIEKVQETIEHAGLAGRVQLVRGPSTTTGAEACRGAGRPIDLLFIDGEHRVQGCAADFETLGAMVRTGGFVVLHDIYPELCGWDGPRYVLNFLAESRCQADKWQILELPTAPATPYGLAVLRKLGEGRTRILPRPVYWLYQFQTRLWSWLQRKRRGT